jgi:hypothetical protein
MSHRKPPPVSAVDVPGELKAAVQDLVTHIGGDGFLVELLTDSGERYYLAFGKPDTIRSFLHTLPADPAGEDLPSIH